MSIDRCPACDYKFTWIEKNGYVNAFNSPSPCPACKSMLVLNKGARYPLLAFYMLLIFSLLMQRVSGKWFPIAMTLNALATFSWIAMLFAASRRKRLEVVEQEISPDALKIVRPSGDGEKRGERGGRQRRRVKPHLIKAASSPGNPRGHIQK